MPTKDHDVKLSNWLDGDLEKRVDEALERAVKNCLDPNYDASPRKVKLTIKISPNERRDEAYPEFHVETILGRLKFIGPAMTIGIDQRGRGVAREYLDRQQSLFNQVVVQLRKEEAE